MVGAAPQFPPTAPWIRLAPEDDAIISEIERERDRGAALIAAALIDERLSQLIKSRLRPERGKPDKAAHDSLFNPGRPLSSHFAKIRLGLLLQLYPPKVAELLETINDIRNKFAHETTPIEFESKGNKEKCARLLETILDTARIGHLFLVEAEKHTRPPQRRTFHVPDDKFIIGMTLTARETFLQGCKVSLFFLAWASDVYANEFVLIDPQGPLPGTLSQQSSQNPSPTRTAPGAGRRRRPRSSPP